MVRKAQYKYPDAYQYVMFSSAKAIMSQIIVRIIELNIYYFLNFSF